MAACSMQCAARSAEHVIAQVADGDISKKVRVDDAASSKDS